MKHSPITFSADGIRGISGRWPFTKVGLSRLGIALVDFLKHKNLHPLVILGRDTRPSGQRYINILNGTLRENGVEVIDMGIAPTPVVAYITKQYNAQLGIIVSASHNPAKYNGIKLVDSNGLRLSSEDEKLIEEQTLRIDVNTISSKRYGKSEMRPELVEKYIVDHIQILGKGCLSRLKMVVDCSNGAVSMTAEKLLLALGANVTIVNNDTSKKSLINNHCGSEYVRHDPKRFINLVRRVNAKYGLAFDGDGDRVVVVDNKGNFFNGDDFLYILATYYAQKHQLRKKTIVTNHNANDSLSKHLRDLQIETVFTPNGDKNIEAEIWKKNYLLGGEQVGNIILKDKIHGAADSLYAIALICKILISEKSTFEKTTKQLIKHPQVMASTYTSKTIPQNVLDKIISTARKKTDPQSKIKITGWHSSTEPELYNFMVEGTASTNLKTISKLAISMCKNIQGKNKSHQSKISILDLSSRKRT